LPASAGHFARAVGPKSPAFLTDFAEKFYNARRTVNCGSAAISAFSVLKGVEKGV
jgi:hypothetical protein